MTMLNRQLRLDCLKAVGSIVAAHCKPDDPAFTSMNALWNDALDHEDPRQERQAETITPEVRAGLQRTDMLRMITAHNSGKAVGMRKRYLQQRTANLASYVHDPRGSAEAFKATIADLIADRSIMVDVNGLVTVLGT